MNRNKHLDVIFYKTAAGVEPVRDWLMTLTKEERTTVGVDIWKVQSEWPIGMPHVRPLGDGLHEVRSNFTSGIARTLFCINKEKMILLHGFIKKTQKTPTKELAIGKKHKKNHENH